SERVSTKTSQSDNSSKKPGKQRTACRRTRCSRLLRLRRGTCGLARKRAWLALTALSSRRSTNACLDYAQTKSRCCMWIARTISGSGRTEGAFRVIGAANSPHTPQRTVSRTIRFGRFTKISAAQSGSDPTEAASTGSQTGAVEGLAERTDLRIMSCTLWLETRRVG